MNQKQKRTYLVYSRGLMPEDLTLGSLYLDPANPLDNERKRFASQLTPRELSAWTGSVQVEQPCSLSTTAGREWLAGAGVFGTLRGHIGRKHSVEVKITGQSGRRLQIKRPEHFLNEVILTSQDARLWLATQLAVSRRISRVARAWPAVSKQPRIWMVTGVQYISGAHITDTASRMLSASVEVALPLPEPVAAIAMVLMPGGPSSLEVTASRQRSDQSQTEYRHADERVWAAQFTALDVKYVQSVGTAGNGALAGWIPLRDLVDLGPACVRSEDNEQEDIERFAEVLGLEEEGAGRLGNGGTALLDVMMDVDWDLLDECLSAAYDSDSDGN